MARVYLLSQPTQLLTHVYVVEGAVGGGCANSRDDVLLVQLFLRALMPPKGSYNNQHVYQPAGEQPLAIDGICGTHTVTYIKAFQKQFNDSQIKDVRKTSWGLVEDGAINPLEGGSLFGKRFNHVMTLVRLNTEYSDVFGIEAHKRLHMNPVFPRELFGSLYLGH